MVKIIEYEEVMRRAEKAEAEVDRLERELKVRIITINEQSESLLREVSASNAAIARAEKAEAECDEVHTGLNDRIKDLSAELRVAFAAEKTANLRADMIARERDAALAEVARLRVAMKPICRTISFPEKTEPGDLQKAVELAVARLASRNEP